MTSAPVMEQRETDTYLQVLSWRGDSMVGDLWAGDGRASDRLLYMYCCPCPKTTASSSTSSIICFELLQREILWEPLLRYCTRHEVSLQYRHRWGTIQLDLQKLTKVVVSTQTCNVHSPSSHVSQFPSNLDEAFVDDFCIDLASSDQSFQKMDSHCCWMSREGPVTLYMYKAYDSTPLVASPKRRL